MKIVFSFFFVILVTSIVCAEMFPNPPVCDRPRGHETSDVRPATYEWVWEHRMRTELSNFRNLIFDQILAFGGSLHYIVRWESNQPVSVELRDQIEAMISRQMNHWTRWLVGYDCWPFDSIPVRTVGWAVRDRSLLQWNDNEHHAAIYVDNQVEPHGPRECNHFYNRNNWSRCPGGRDRFFHMALWATDGFRGGAGGDWGQRVGTDYVIRTVNNDQAHIILHEIGHGFGLPDFYEPHQFPPASVGELPRTIMRAGNSAVITPWDGWALRHFFSMLKANNDRGWVLDQVTSVMGSCLDIENIKVLQAYPNPFNPTTNVRFAVSRPEKIDVRVFDINGKTIASHSANYPAGEHVYTFNATGLTSGVYFLVIESGEGIVEQKLMLLK